MTSVYAAQTDNQSVSEHPSSEYQLPLFGNVDEQPRAKWTYLVADKVTCSSHQQYMLRVQKPSDALLVEWLYKIIQGGQCDKLIVEDLSVPVQQLVQLQALCRNVGVTLVNLNTSELSQIAGSDKANARAENGTFANVVKGPWLA